MAAISSGCSFRPGGIFSSPDCSIARTSRLSAGLPGLIAAPRLPPARMASRESSASPLDRFAWLWHAWQFVFRICWIPATAGGATCWAISADSVTSAQNAPNTVRQNRPWRSIVTHYTLSDPAVARNWLVRPYSCHQIPNDQHVHKRNRQLHDRKMPRQFVDFEWYQSAGRNDGEILRPALS